MSIPVTNSEFLRALCAGLTQDTQAWVCAFDGDPGEAGPAWYGQGYIPGGPAEQVVDSWGGRNTYFSLAAVRRDGQRKLPFFDRLLALTGDDIDPDQLAGTPSMVLRTSERSRQATVFIDPQDPDARDLRLIGAVLHQFYERGLAGADRSGNNAIRYVRLPQGTNQKPGRGMWQHRVEAWNPGQVMTLEDATAVFGVDLDAIKASPALQAPASIPGAGPGGALATFHQGSLGVTQDEKLGRALDGILRGEALHESINVMAASLVASGMAPGTAVNLLDNLILRSAAPRDERWEQRRRDIARSVSTAAEKFHRGAATMPPLPVIDLRPSNQASSPSGPGVVVDEDGVIHQPQPMPAEPAGLAKPIIAGYDPNAFLPRGDIDWLIEGYFEARSMSLDFGPSAMGKTFVKLDQMLCIAMGLPWMGRKVKRGIVVYIAGEGHSGLARRVQAWCIENGQDPREVARFFRVSQRGIAVLDRHGRTADFLQLVQEMDAIAIEAHANGFGIAESVFDTLARTLGGEENSNTDISRYTAALEDLRDRYSCAISVVHHTGKAGDTPRGAGALEGNFDYVYRIEGNIASLDGMTYKCLKAKDGEKPLPLVFELGFHPVGRASNGKPLKSGVARPRGGRDSIPVAIDRTGQPVSAALAAQKVKEAFGDWVAAGQAANVDPDAWEWDAMPLVRALGLLQPGDGTNVIETLSTEAEISLSRTGYFLKLHNGKDSQPNQ